MTLCLLSAPCLHTGSASPRWMQLCSHWKPITGVIWGTGTDSVTGGPWCLLLLLLLCCCCGVSWRAEGTELNMILINDLLMGLFKYWIPLNGKLTEMLNFSPQHFYSLLTILKLKSNLWPIFTYHNPLSLTLNKRKKNDQKMGKNWLVWKFSMI